MEKENKGDRLFIKVHWVTPRKAIHVWNIYFISDVVYLEWFVQVFY